MQAALSEATNTKLGPLIHGWSIPAGRRWTCPGESHLCGSRCYAKSGFFRMPSVRDSHIRNYRFSQLPEFAAWMLASLKLNFVRVMRVHVSGDFYDVEYVRKWLHIVQRSPDCLFFAYTRSWREEEMLPELVQLGGQPNFQLWWSIDRDTGPAPLIRGVRRAYMAIDDTDALCAPDDCDLVFRDQTATVMKRANGVQVCPVENGVELKVKLTCSHCGICWNKNKTRWETDLSMYFDATDQEIVVPELQHA